MKGHGPVRRPTYLAPQVPTGLDGMREGTTMGKANARLDAARKSYREALESARKSPTPEAWARLLAAGKELSAAEDPRPRSRRGRRAAPPPELVETIEPGGEAEPEPVEGLD
jgi:hypothetical protein